MTISDLYQRVVRGQENLSSISNLMATWSKSPLLERRDGKPDNLLDLAGRGEKVSKRYTEISEAGEKIASWLEANKQFFKADDNDPKNWQAYIDEVDGIIGSGFVETITCSLAYLIQETEENSNQSPLFEIKMDLVASEVVFTPALSQGPNTTFKDIRNSLVDDIYKQAAQIRRITAREGEDETYEV